MNADVKLYDYWRSSASYRVRIALNSLDIIYERVPVDLLKAEHKGRENIARNPQGLVPTLVLGDKILTQSLAIIEYLNETHPDAGFLPESPLGRQRVRALSYAIAMEIHPICNMNVAAHVVSLTGDGDVARGDWMRKFISEGLMSVELMLDHSETGAFCHGDTPGMADFCLVPQIYNAKRWGVELGNLPRVNEITERCNELPAFVAAHPDQVK
ncbi:maleylacetoacetate isomerase [Phyllobacterium sp. YR531]|uniref:maleylacetoacetate isomerase n=1 Tax=Phyllobacterium sp. YR531 TaxID=1144343 RepID=UPI00026FA183|nr:maleylacetoacetate isomerase [Phyllobacterium sp. YR531]EJN02226.1 maleylacetoacetate isomerase [Phyllobacterium sp. YR531]